MSLVCGHVFLYVSYWLLSIVSDIRGSKVPIFIVGMMAISIQTSFGHVLEVRKVDLKQYVVF
jgi:hypothetical protein